MDWNDLFNKWYVLLSSLNSALSMPLRDLSDGLGIPLVSAFLFGLLGTTAPCQLTTNFGALAFLTRQPADRAGTFRATLAYIAAKALVYTILGIIVLTLGQGLISAFLPYMEWARKLIGPVMIVLGLAILGAFNVRLQAGQKLADRLERQASSVDARQRTPAPVRLQLAPQRSLVTATALAETNSTPIGPASTLDAKPIVEAAPAVSALSARSSFLLGLGFSLAFCPTLFLLFFIVTMTLAARSAGSFAFPAFFALGTTLPLLLLVGVTLTGAGAAKQLRRGMRKANKPLRWIGAAVLILLGLHDTFVYWFL